MSTRKQTHVEVVHDLVGAYYKGAVVSADKFDNLEHLLSAGAVEWTDATDETTPTDSGARQTLPEAMRYPSSVTLPNIPNVDADPQHVRDVMHVAPEEAAITTAQTVDADAESFERNAHDASHSAELKGEKTKD